MGIKSKKVLDIGDNNTLTILQYGNEEPELNINGDLVNCNEARQLVDWIKKEFLNLSNFDEPCPCVPLNTPADKPWLPKDFTPVPGGPTLIGLEERKAVSSTPMRQIMSNGAVIEAKDDLEVVDMAQLKKSLGA